MRCVWMVGLLAGGMGAQVPVAPVPAVGAVQTELRGALLGDWVGVLEYRDYSEPAGSTKRVELPTWLSIAGSGPLTWHYVYDDGPGKALEEMDLVTFDPEANRYTSVDNGKPPQVFAMTDMRV